MNKRERGREIKGRNTKEKQRAKIYIFTEGDTEEIYLKHFEIREYNAEVIPKDPKCTDAVGIVTRAKTFVRKDQLDLELGDRADCVFDSDPASNPNIQLAFDLIRGMYDEGLRCIFSNPSFEVWFMLHLKKNIPYGLTAYQMKAQLKNELRQVFPGYCETTDIYHWLKDKQKTAYQHAKYLHNFQQKRYEKVLSHECNPYTNIFEFIDYMESIKRSKSFGDTQQAD